jgi:hypothetical protein
MRHHSIRTAAISCFALAAVLLPTAAAPGGPPAICHPVEIGASGSLPWGPGPLAPDSSYSPAGVIQDTIEILDRQQDVLVHMETLRRASIYVKERPRLASDLFALVTARTLDAEAAGRDDPLAWLDAGYLAQCYDQVGLDLPRACGREKGVAGYGWVRHAIELRGGDDARLEFAAAMVTVLAPIREHEAHADRARRLAGDDALLRRNLEKHVPFWQRHFRGGN